MNTYKLIIAISLLTNPDASPNSDDLNALHTYLSPSLIDLALKLELMDPREKTELFVDPQNFTFDMKLLQRRFQELVGAPLVSEADRFPQREVINEFLSFNRGYKEELEQKLALHHLHADDIQQAIAETDHLHQIWCTLKDARSSYYVSARRQALKNLRDLVGDTAFYRAELPPSIPVWRLPRAW